MLHLEPDFNVTSYGVANRECAVLITDGGKKGVKQRICNLSHAVGCSVYGNMELASKFIELARGAAKTLHQTYGFDVSFDRLKEELDRTTLPCVSNGRLGYSSLFISHKPCLGPQLVRMYPDNGLICWQAAAIGVNGVKVLENHDIDEMKNLELDETVKQVMVNFYEGTKRPLNPETLIVGVLSNEKPAFRILNFCETCNFLEEAGLTYAVSNSDAQI